MGKIERIGLAPGDGERLEKLVRDRNTPQKVVWRARLLAADGVGAVEVGGTVGKSLVTVRRWRRRSAAAGVEGLLKDATRPPGRAPLTAEVIKRVVDLTLHQTPPNATHWTERSMAAAVGIAPSSVYKIRKAHGLKPHLVETFKLSRDPAFAEKVEADDWRSKKESNCWRLRRRSSDAVRDLVRAREAAIHSWPKSRI